MIGGEKVARPLRIEYEGAIFHVTARGNERQKIFFSQRDYEKFKEYLAAAVEKYGVIIRGYVLMTNHYHLLIETPEKNLSKVMHYINGSYTTYGNIKRKRSGHLFQGRFKSIVVERDSYLLELSRYLHLNPVRAKIVEKPEDYPYSSYNAYTTMNSDSLVDTTTILAMLESNPDAAKTKYKSFVESALGGEIESPFKKVYGGIILGGSDFIKEVLRKIEAIRLTKADISNRRILRAKLLPEEIVSALCSHYGLTLKSVINRERNDIKRRCLYLLKKHTSATNREIGDLLAGMGTAAVAKAYQRFAKELTTNPDLQKEMKVLEGNLSRVKG